MPIEIPCLPIIINPELSKNILSINEQFITNRANTLNHEFIDEQFSGAINNLKKINDSIFQKRSTSPKKNISKIHARTKLSTKLDNQEELENYNGYKENEISSYYKNPTSSNFYLIFNYDCDICLLSMIFNQGL